MIGLGIMGSAMSKNLIRAGFSVIGYDVLPKAVEAFVGFGGKAAKSIGEVGSGADILITSLPSANALFDVVRQLAALPRAERIVAETSTFTLEDKAAAAAATRAGGDHHARLPTFWLRSSGPGAGRAGLRQRPEKALTTAVCRCSTDFRGLRIISAPFGNGSKMKYVANLMVAVHTVVAGEAFTLARKAGLDPAQMFAVVSDGAAGSRALDVRGEMLIADTYLPIRTMPLELWRKDMRVIADFANSLACPTPMFSAAVPLYQRGGRFRVRRSGYGRSGRRDRSHGGIAKHRKLAEIPASRLARRPRLRKCS